MLPEDKRSQLDGIVQQMVSNGEPDTNIQAVVGDFKQKYSAQKDEAPAPSAGVPLPSSPEDTSHGPVVGALIGGGKAAINFVPSLVNDVANIAGTAIRHPINTIEGIGRTAIGAGEALGNKLIGADTGDQVQDKNQQAFSNFTQSLKDRYGSLENLQKTATNDPAGLGLDVLTVLEGGTSLTDRALGTTGVDIARQSAIDQSANFAKTGIKVMPTVGEGKVSGALNAGLKTAADAVIKPAKAVAGGTYNFGTNIVGNALGVEGNTIKQGVSASITGGDAYKSFVEGLKGNTTQVELVNEARGALDEVYNKRSQNYQDMLSTIKSDPSTYNIAPVSREFENQLQKFGITKAEDGTLDFSRSTLSDASDVSKVNQIYQDIKNWGTKPGDRTALGIDTLKRRIANYYSPTSDFRAMTTALGNKTREVLNRVPGYTAEMKNYGDLTDQITDIKKGLSLGDNVMVETSFKKLTGAFKQNNEFRAQLIQELDDASGGQLLPKIAGQQLSSWIPRGLMAKIEAGGGILSVMHGGTGIVPLLIATMATSPKIVGMFIQSLRLPATIAQKTVSILGKASVPVLPTAIGGNAVNRATGQSDTPSSSRGIALPLAPSQ